MSDEAAARWVRVLQQIDSVKEMKRGASTALVANFACALANFSADAPFAETGLSVTLDLPCFLAFLAEHPFELPLETFFGNNASKSAP